LSPNIEENEINQDGQNTMTAQPPDNMNTDDQQLDARATSPTKGDVVRVSVAPTQEDTERERKGVFTLRHYPDVDSCATLNNIFG
jgi:hypothetical protein